MVTRFVPSHLYITSGRSYPRYLIFISLCLWLMACSSSSAPTDGGASDRGLIAGRVVDQGAVPIAGAVVTVIASATSDTTDAQGLFSLQAQAGTAALRFGGFPSRCALPADTTVVVVTRQTTSIVITAQCTTRRDASISGILLDERAFALRGALISDVGGDSSATDSLGLFTLRVASGPVRIRVSQLPRGCIPVADTLVTATEAIPLVLILRAQCAASRMAVVRGVLVNQEGRPVGGVVASSITDGVADTTDATGRFDLPVTSGAVTVRFRGQQAPCRPIADLVLQVRSSDTLSVRAVANCAPQVFAAFASSVGPRGSCAVDASLRAWCWGVAGGSRNPVIMALPSGVRPIDLDLGVTSLNQSGTCMLANAPIGQGGAVYCWEATTVAPAMVLSGPYVSLAGRNFSGQICAVSLTGRLECGGVVVPALRGRLVESAYVREPVGNRVGDSGCAVSDGAAYCWGSNRFGMLGAGLTVSRSDTAVAVRRPSGEGRVRMLNGGDENWCAVYFSGSLYCWGGGVLLGDGGGTEADSSSVPVRVRIPADVQIFEVSVGVATACATGRRADQSAAVFCWGFNDRGQLGRPQPGFTAVPLEVIVPGGARFFVKVDKLSGHACITSLANDLYCWGANESGQLGDGTRLDCASPKRVLGATEPLEECPVTLGVPPTTPPPGTVSACTITVDPSSLEVLLPSAPVGARGTARARVTGSAGCGSLVVALPATAPQQCGAPRCPPSVRITPSGAGLAWEVLVEATVIEASREPGVWRFSVDVVGGGGFSEAPQVRRSVPITVAISR